MLLAGVLKRFVSVGHLRMIDAHGRIHDAGESGTEPSVTVRLHDPTLHWKIGLLPKIAVGEAYMDGTLTIEDGTIVDFFEVIGRNLQNLERDDAVGRASTWIRRNITRPLQQHNPVSRAQRNVAHHYDLSDDLFDLFLDDDRQYSCAYFATPNSTLEQAQADKKRHIGAKLLLEPGQRVLDIGSGWGGMGLYLAQQADVEVVGVTLSKEQHEVSSRRAREAGLDDRVRFHLQDYRELDGTFDRIVSVGMFEHVGAHHYLEFFRKVRSLMTDNSVMLLHSIGRFEEPGNTNAWLRKYIFPGGYTPALSEVFTQLERSNLLATDLEILKTHYAETLKHWHCRFTVNRDKVRELYDERFCRMWEFYLLGCESVFRYDDQMVFQLQIAKNRYATPETRDYMVDWERTHA
ncbi:MAG: SAM-dependent methyltransferase [Rhodospirillaceae bacterium]|nr:SAM-dependent methyltransferase [Rhodospirillaceae bacterium]|tara:strand:- start:1985 stop:3199 length:1215 start_codon:yes stop_codon:yes gene_type:complete